MKTPEENYSNLVSFLVSHLGMLDTLNRMWEDATDIKDNSICQYYNFYITETLQRLGEEAPELKSADEVCKYVSKISKPHILKEKPNAAIPNFLND